MQITYLIAFFTFLTSVWARASDFDQDYYDDQQLSIEKANFGAIVILTPVDEDFPVLDESLTRLVSELSTYTEEALHQRVKHAYDTLFYGLAIEFTNPEIIEQWALNENQVGASSEALLSGLYNAFTEFKQRELRMLNVRLDISKDVDVLISQ